MISDVSVPEVGVLAVYPSSHPHFTCFPVFNNVVWHGAKHVTLERVPDNPPLRDEAIEYTGWLSTNQQADQSQYDEWVVINKGQKTHRYIIVHWPPTLFRLHIYNRISWNLSWFV